LLALAQRRRGNRQNWKFIFAQTKKNYRKEEEGEEEEEEEKKVSMSLLDTPSRDRTSPTKILKWSNLA